MQVPQTWSSVGAGGIMQEALDRIAIASEEDDDDDDDDDDAMCNGKTSSSFEGTDAMLWRIRCQRAFFGNRRVAAYAAEMWSQALDESESMTK